MGLQNIGNTCYVNSLVQMYFHLPEFRREVLSIVEPESYEALDNAMISENAAENSIRFMHELQRLFGFMALSDRKYVSCERWLKSMLSYDNTPVRVGHQEDVGEFNLLFLQRAEEGLEALHGDGESEGGEGGESGSGGAGGATAEAASAVSTPVRPTVTLNDSLASDEDTEHNLVKALFYGTTVDTFDAVEEDGTPVRSLAKEEFGQVGLCVVCVP